jgi:formylglycine-generating enzyme required for sulfatase activity
MYKCPKCGGEILAYRSELHFVRYRIEGGKANLHDKYDDEMIEVYAEGFECTRCLTRYNDAYGEKPIYKFVFVEGGSFQMGNTENDGEGQLDEKPAHTVNLTYDYLIGEREVTFDEYATFCTETFHRVPDDFGWGRGMQPAINVSWWGAISYCNWLSQKEGIAIAYDNKGSLLDKNGNRTAVIETVHGYRLPTEAEWEYAARGGLKRKGYKYAGSDTLSEVGWYKDNSGGQTHPVGQKLPNELGLYDMSGNVIEWCHDWYGDYTSMTQTNPTGPISGSFRVNRGGCWDIDEQHCRVAHRGNGAAVSGDFGFRVARTAKPED